LYAQSANADHGLAIAWVKVQTSENHPSIRAILDGRRLSAKSQQVKSGQIKSGLAVRRSDYSVRICRRFAFSIRML
jgi:hypothetical protein